MIRFAVPLRGLAVALLAVLAAGCVSHIAPYKPRKRVFDAGRYDRPYRPGSGSLYLAGKGLFEDDIATGIGDTLVIRIDERDAATRDADSTLAKSNKTAYGVSSSFGLLNALQASHPNIDPASLFGSDSSSQFAGSGSLNRKGTLSATLPVRVRQVLPNGDFYVEGTKVVMVGAEENHVYLSGIVRRTDIAEDNTVPSSRVADAEIEYVGRGDVSDQQRAPWLSRTLNTLWPF